MVNTIIFDFGNVLINLDFDRCFSAFRRLLNVQWGLREAPSTINEAIIQYDKGLITDSEFVASFQTINPAVAFQDVKDAWNSLIADVPGSRFNFLKELGDKYRLILLSNINAFHVNRVHEILEVDHGILNFESAYFDRVFYSHLIGKRKPEPDIYEYVQTELKLEGDKILFIDDLAENIEAARVCGWHGQIHDPADDIELKLKQYLEALENAQMHD
ncbi:MAG: HAD family phosphatase [Saprospiraceae bacterium]|nr:HAD family phosphatase [Saprospiraceae bacterium]